MGRRRLWTSSNKNGRNIYRAYDCDAKAATVDFVSLDEKMLMVMEFRAMSGLAIGESGC
jgi:hypothetical protein